MSQVLSELFDLIFKTVLECKYPFFFFFSEVEETDWVQWNALQNHMDKKSGTAGMRSGSTTLRPKRRQHSPFLHLLPFGFLEKSSCIFPPPPSLLALSTLHFLKGLAMEIIWVPHAKMRHENGENWAYFYSILVFYLRWQMENVTHLVPSGGRTFALTPWVLWMGGEQCCGYINSFSSCMNLKGRWEGEGSTL